MKNQENLNQNELQSNEPQQQSQPQSELKEQNLQTQQNLKDEPQQEASQENLNEQNLQKALTQKELQNHIKDKLYNTKQENLLTFLSKHYPEAFSENHINLDSLKRILGLETQARGYELNFTGKPLANAIYTRACDKELRFDFSFSPYDSKTNHTQAHTIIRGDNLDALKILKQAYSNKIKMIYIDPPYNTKNENFIYPDDFRKDFKEILKETGLLEIVINDKGEEEERESEHLKFFRNITGSKSHSGWLSFMLPRLKLARDLLKEDGVIFISIDDNEQANLKLLCDEIFGEENFVSNLVWHSVSSVLKQSQHFRKEHEYILCYAKSKENLSFSKLENSMKFENIDNDPRGEWFSSNAASPNQKDNKNKFPIELPNGEQCVRNWKFSYDDFINKKVSLYFKGSNVPRLKIYKSDYNVSSKIQASILNNFGSLTSAKTELESILISKDYFDTPKPINLIKHLLKISTTAGGGGELSSHSLDSKATTQESNKATMLSQQESKINKSNQNLDFNQTSNNPDSNQINNIDSKAEAVEMRNRGLQGGGEGSYLNGNDRADNEASAIYRSNATPQKEQKDESPQKEIILDFFAGSGTTLHAVMSLNAQDGGNRACILVQCDEKINENISKAAFDFCKNELKSNEPVISDITIERVKRASIKFKETHPLERLALGFSVFSLVEKSKLEDEDDSLKLFYSNISKKDRARNLSLLDEKPKMLHTELTELIKDSLYKCENSIYVASLNDEVLDYLRNTKDEKVYINGFEIDNLEAYKNLESMLDTRLHVVY